MEFPDFKNDQEMADWFEAQDIEASDLEIANDVVIADDLAVVLVAEVYSFRPGETSSANAAPTVEGQRDLAVTRA